MQVEPQSEESEPPRRDPWPFVAKLLRGMAGCVCAPVVVTLCYGFWSRSWSGSYPDLLRSWARALCLSVPLGALLGVLLVHFLTSSFPMNSVNGQDEDKS